MPLNWLASSSSSSDVFTSMRWPKSPAPSRRAPARSAVIGTSMRRAMMVPAMIATTRPSPIRSAIRTSWSRIGVSACAVSCSKNTCQPSFGTRLDVVSTALPLMSVPDAGATPPGLLTAATCGSVDRFLPTSGPVEEAASTSPRESVT